MKKFLTNKKGVTLLEGLIALMLLALVATGTLGALLSTSRKSTTPDVREAMVLAVEQATKKLGLYVYDGDEPEDLQTNGNLKKICPDEQSSETDLFEGNNTEHHIECLLPPICDRNNSSFTYRVTNAGASADSNLEDVDKVDEDAVLSYRQISFNISCNGYSL